MRLILLRHTEAKRGARPSDGGPESDEGLTERGIAQAYALAEHLRRADVAQACDAFLTSPLRRAVETAEILAKTLSLAPFEHEGSLSEVCELTDRQETVAEAFSRVSRELARLADAAPEATILAVTHAGFIVASMVELLGAPRSGSRARLEPDHGSLTQWHFGEGVWRLERYNVLPLNSVGDP